MIRNYTSSVPAERSITNIERKLVAFGARNIAKQYDDNHRVCGLVFDLPIDNNKRSVPVAIPARTDRVQEAMLLKPGCPRNTEKLEAQAERTAWKLMLDWVDLQLTLIELNQAEPAEVFMPYMVVVGRKTVYEAFRDGGFKMLEAPKA